MTVVEFFFLLPSVVICLHLSLIPHARLHNHLGIGTTRPDVPTKIGHGHCAIFQAPAFTNMKRLPATVNLLRCHCDQRWWELISRGFRFL